jgi:uncharacterized protein (UPF0276 family)
VPLPELGVGVIYTPALQPLLAAEADLASVVEVEPQTLWTFTADPAAPYRPDPSALALLDELPQAKLVHGVGFPIGGSRPPDPRHLPVFVEMIERLRSPWASEHLAFNRAAGGGGEFATGFLLPPLQTPAGVAAAAASIRSVAPHLPVPFAVETGVNYLQPRPGEMSDGAFVAAVAEAADCGILLDLHNLWTNERNGRQPLEEALSELPLERVWEIHIAGGSEFRGYWLDAHSGAVPGDLVALARRLLPALPEVRAMVFEITPTFLERMGLEGVRRQIAELREIWEARARSPRPALPSPAPRMVAEAGFSPEDWEDGLGALVVGRPSESPAYAALAGDPGVDILRRLVWNFRSGALVDALPFTSKLLLIHGEPLTRELLDGFFAASPPELFASNEAEAFGAYLDTRRPDVPYLEEVLAFDLAAIRAKLLGKPQLIPFRHEPRSVLDPIAQGRLPESPQLGNYEVEVTPGAEDRPGAAGVISSS